MENKKRIPIPHGVVNANEYRKFIAYQSHPLFNEERYQRTDEDPELVIDLAKFDHHIKELVSNLSEQEQTRILDLKRKYRQLLTKRSMAKKRAYGGEWGRTEKQDLLKGRKDDVIILFGRMFDLDEVVEIINEEWYIPVTKKEVREFRMKHIKEIESRQELFKNNYTHLRLTHKTSRLEEMTWLYQTAKKRYVESQTLPDYDRMLKTMEAIRKEIEGDRITIDATHTMKFEDDVRNHIQNQIFSKLILKEIVLGRIAARMGVRVEKLIEALNNSYYAKFEMKKLDHEHSEMIYPSSVNYDFEKIERFNKLVEIEEAEIVEETPEPEAAERALTTKEILLNKIKAKQAEVKESQSKIDALKQR
jgi:hypothetical protein